MLVRLQRKITQGSSMALTVQAAFNTFFDEINLSGDHRTIANSRRDHLIELLGNKFDVVEAFPSGSISKYTALHGQADLDIMLVLHFGKHIEGKTPTEVLQAVRDSIAYKTKVRKNGQAVTLHYTSWPSVDIVPVNYVYKDNNIVTHYRIPDANTDTWINSNPKTHTTAIQNKASECGDIFRKVIKFAKHWNKGHSDYLQSYHIEVLALRIFDSYIGEITWDTFKFFNEAVPLLQYPMWDEWGQVDSYLSAYNRQEVIRRLEKARDLARTAWFHTYSPNFNHASAIAMWRQIFGEKFPVYG